MGSKKTKKAKAADNQEVTNAAEENQMEVTQAEVQEVVPATIVEAGEAEVFSSQGEGKEVEAVSEGEIVEADNQPVEKVAEPGLTESAPEQTAEKPKTDRRPYIPYLTEALEEPQDRKILLKTILEKWPTVSKGGCQTFMTDMLNPKYSHFKDRPVIKLPDGKVVFADKAPIPVVASAEEEQPTEAEVPAVEVVVLTEEEQTVQPYE